jgi:hypothetical protein
MAKSRPTKGATAGSSGTAETTHRTTPTGEVGTTVTPESVVQNAERAVAAVQEAAAASAADTRPSLVGETAGDSDVTDELSGGGVAFGEFVKSVGLAVAAAQTELDNNLAATAEQLSKTQIDVIAVFEQVTKDSDGSMDEGIIHLQKLPLINYLMPTAYQWKRVYLEADMNVQEFNSRSGFNIQQKAVSLNANVSGSASLLGGSITASTNFGFSNTSTGVDASNSVDTAAGKLHMEATLEPRADVELPRPFILQKGPKLDVQVGSKAELKEDSNDPTKITGYQVVLTALLTKLDGSPNDAKPLSVTVSDPTMTFTSAGKTDAQGSMTVTVKRKVLDPATDKPVQALVRTSFGLVTTTVGIVL